MSNTVGQDTNVYLENGVKTDIYGLRRTTKENYTLVKLTQLAANDP